MQLPASALVPVRRTGKAAQGEDAPDKPPLTAPSRSGSKSSVGQQPPRQVESSPGATSSDESPSLVVDSGSYASRVRAAYWAAWKPPEESDDSAAFIEVDIVIANNGHVLSSDPVAGSGDARLERSVQQALKDVQSVEAFPSAWKETSMKFRLRFDFTVSEQLLAKSP